MSDFHVGDRVRVREGAPVRLAGQSDRMGIVLRSNDTGLSDVWVHSQCCEFELDFTELELVERAHYAPPGVPMIAMDPDDRKALALLNDGFDRGQLVCDSFKATQSEQDDLARAMLRLERIVRACAEAKR